jgi:hypothetical protein
MSVEEVRQQVEYVALVTKQASSVSDLRRFAFSAPAISAPVVYFRAAAPGVCTYMDDRRDAGGPPGCCGSVGGAGRGVERRHARLLPACSTRPGCPPSPPAPPTPAAVPHGACWYDLCDDCEVIDVPGDHFSILRQVG